MISSPSLSRLTKNAILALLVMFVFQLGGCSWFKRSEPPSPIEVPAPVEFNPAQTIIPPPEPIVSEPPESVPITEERPVVVGPAGEWLEIIYFDFDDSRIRPNQLSNIDKNLRYLLDHPDLEVLVTGHCDERGTTEYNFALGERRAKAVVDYFIRNGIDTRRVDILSWGEESPLADGSTEAAYAKNRRCEFYFIEQ